MKLKADKAGLGLGLRLALTCCVFILCLGGALLPPAAALYQQTQVADRAKAYRDTLLVMLQTADELEFPDIMERVPSVVGANVHDSNGRSIYGFGVLPDMQASLENTPEPVLNGDYVEAVWSINFFNRGYQIAVSIDGEGIAAARMTFIQRMAMVVTVAALLGFFLTRLMSTRYVVKPVREVIRSLRNARINGDKHLIVLEGRDEFGTLIQEYNNMIQSLEAVEAQVEKKQMSLEHLAHHDQLTGLPNRVHCKRKLKQLVAAAQKKNIRLAAMLIDLDNFKLFNDQFDQHTGDLVVAEVAKRLECALDEDVTIGRLDGDEFLVVSEIRRQAEVVPLADKLRQVISEPISHRAVRFAVNASVGVATLPGDAENAEELLNNATYALAEAKVNGRAQTQLFTDEIRDKVLNRIKLEDEIKNGVSNREFVLFYQPKLSLETRQPMGAEALVRWNHPERGLVGPGGFIEVAEETGLIIPLSDWIVDEACRQVAEWNRVGLTGLQIAVNLSALQFQDPDLVAKISGAIERHGIEPSSIELEITESAIMNDPVEANKLLDELKGLGVTLAIDDFGTGYSSLSYLKNFPVHTLKIDQSFVRDLETESADAAIVNAIIGLGRHFGMKVVAEGIETEPQYQFLLQTGAQVGQGYLFAKPLPAVDFGRWALDQLNGGGDTRRVANG
ncbi:MAG: EAL domain-containing protein [Pseudomonadota bacterium]